METRSIIEGLQLLEPFYDKATFTVSAEHDEIFAHQTDRPLTPEGVAKMVELGWVQPDAEVPDDEDFAVEHYDPEQSWSAYV